MASGLPLSILAGDRQRPPGRIRRTFALRRPGLSSAILVFHLRVFPDVVEPGVGAVVEAEHDVLFVAGPDVVVVAQRKVLPRLGRAAGYERPEILALRPAAEARCSGHRVSWGITSWVEA